MANAIIAFNHPLNKYLTPVSAKQTHPLFALRALSFYNATCILKYMAGGIPKKQNQRTYFGKIPYITCLRSQRAHLNFKTLLLEKNLNTFYLEQAE